MTERDHLMRELEAGENETPSLDHAARLYLRALAIAEPGLMRRAVVLMKRAVIE